MPSGDGTPRTYSIVLDTANGVVNPRLLRNEIDNDAGITTARRNGANGGWKTTFGDILEIYFVAALSAGEITALDALMGAHLGTVTSQTFQFWESNPTQSTLSEAWQNAMSRTASPVASGIYRLTWYFELRVVPVTTLDSAVVARFRVDSSRKGDAYHASTKWSGFSGWDRIIFDEGETPLLEIDFRREPDQGGDDNVEIRKLKLSVDLAS